MRCFGRKYYVYRQGLRTLLPSILLFSTWLLYINLILLFRKFATVFFFQMNGNQKFWPYVIMDHSSEERLYLGTQQNKKTFTDDRSRANPRILVALETSMFKIFVLLYVSYQNKTINLDFQFFALRIKFTSSIWLQYLTIRNSP